MQIDSHSNVIFIIKLLFFIHAIKLVALQSQNERFRLSEGEKTILALLTEARSLGLKHNLFYPTYKRRARYVIQLLLAYFRSALTYFLAYVFTSEFSVSDVLQQSLRSDTPIFERSAYLICSPSKCPARSDRIASRLSRHVLRQAVHTQRRTQPADFQRTQ